jgi:hypothetical protein
MREAMESFEEDAPPTISRGEYTPEETESRGNAKG